MHSHIIHEILYDTRHKYRFVNPNYYSSSTHYPLLEYYGKLCTVINIDYSNMHIHVIGIHFMPSCLVLIIHHLFICLDVSTTVQLLGISTYQSNTLYNF